MIILFQVNLSQISRLTKSSHRYGKNFFLECFYRFGQFFVSGLYSDFKWPLRSTLVILGIGWVRGGRFYFRVVVVESLLAASLRWLHFSSSVVSSTINTHWKKNVTKRTNENSHHSFSLRWRTRYLHLVQQASVRTSLLFLTRF